MATDSIYELKCRECDLQYAQMISDREEHLPIPCPSCDTDLEKMRKLTGADLLACGIAAGAG
jgi:hypothetical protein